MKLISMKLRNFKGIKDLTLDLSGQDLNVYGENGTGKTTIFDAFMWLLFNKDSQNSSQFNIKPLDSLGEPSHMMEHEVTAVIEHEGKEIELQKIYKENWTKKRGQAEKELTGHTTEYSINSVPKKLKEFNEFLSYIIDEDTFKIITNPLFFNTKVDWKKRRSIAMEICGEVELQEIFVKNAKLLDLKDLLSDKSIEDIQSEMSARRRKLNEEIKSIPYRIDELSRTDQEVQDINILLESKKALEDERSDLKNAKTSDLDFRIRNIEGGIKVFKNQLTELQQNATKDFREKINETMEEGAAVKKLYLSKRDHLEEQQRQVKKYTRDIDFLDTKLSDLRIDFDRVRNLTFDMSSNICPTCNQELPPHEIQKHIDQFNAKNTEKLMEYNLVGKGLRENKLETEQKLNAIDLTDLEEVVTALQKEMHAKAELVKSLETQLKNIDITSTKEYQDILSQIQLKEQEIKEIQELQKSNDNTSKLKELNDKLDSISKQIAKIDLMKDNEKRVIELKERERELSNMIADLEKKEFLAEQFIITKSNLLEEKLNQKFKIVKFKLFDTQVNGGINETFIATVNGVPYEDLNNAMKINAGLDIINTLTEYYQFEAPIFIDNRESVNEIVDIKSQIINLVVTKDKELKFELIENREVA